MSGAKPGFGYHPLALMLTSDQGDNLVSTAGFDATMLAIGNALFPDRIGVHETGQYLNARTNSQIENYEKAYKKLTAYKDNKIPGEDLPILVRKNMRKPSST